MGPECCNSLSCQEFCVWLLLGLPAPRRLCIAPSPPCNSSKLPSLGSFPVGREVRGGLSALLLHEGVGSVTAVDVLSFF